jgi:hypothetical protein
MSAITPFRICQFCRQKVTMHRRTLWLRYDRTRCCRRSRRVFDGPQFSRFTPVPPDYVRRACQTFTARRCTYQHIQFVCQHFCADNRWICSLKAVLWHDVRLQRSCPYFGNTGWIGRFPQVTVQPQITNRNGAEPAAVSSAHVEEFQLVAKYLFRSNNRNFPARRTEWLLYEASSGMKFSAVVALEFQRHSTSSVIQFCLFVGSRTF